QREKGLNNNEEEMRKSLSAGVMKNSRVQPEQILIEQLCDCCW
ncbi:unnamed protein product, partial [Tetraodon nigroviridis]